MENLVEAKGLWVEQLHEEIWSYHTTPYSIIMETLFTLVHEADVMLSVKIDTPTW